MSTPGDGVAPGIAIDIGGSKIALGRADAALHETIVRVATPSGGGPEAIIGAIARAARRLAADGPIDRVVVASAGSLDTATGVIRWASNLPFEDYPIVERLAAALRAPVILVGDTTAALIAEFSVPERRTVRNGMYITVSSGIGVGLLFDGRIYTGHRGHAGELGHVPVAPHDGVACRCGQRGCLEAYASGRGLVDRAAAMLAECEPGGPLAAAARGGRLSAKVIIEAAAEGDPIAARLVDDGVDHLAVAIASAIRILGPEVVVLGGGLMLADHLADELRCRILELLAFDPTVMGSLLARAALGDHSPLEGARAICRRDPRAMAMGADAGWT